VYILIDSRQAMSREEFQQRRRSSPGLSDRDVRVLEANIEAIETLSPRKTLHPARVLPKPSRDMPELYGVRASYEVIHSLKPAEGRFFSDEQNEQSASCWERRRR
jgi:putative ABC transport system permease protein